MHHSLVILGANAMAAFIDFGVGALIAAVIHLHFGLTPSLLALFLGGCLALLPDLDVVPSIATGRAVGFDHRKTLFHRPLLLIPLATAVALMLAGPLWALITLATVTYHFLHDTDFAGTKQSGIAWFWPFSDQFWSWYGSYQVISVGDHHAWLWHHWLGPSRRGVFELSVGFITLTVALVLSQHQAAALLIIPAILIGQLSIMLLAKFA